MAIYTVWKAKRKGKIHGRDWKWSFWPFFKSSKPVNPSDNCSEVTNYEKSIIDGAEADIAKIKEQYYRKDAKLKQKYCHLISVKGQLERSAPHESEQAKQAKKKFEDLQKKLAELGQPAIKEWVVKLILFLFILTEFPLNAIVFSIFGEGRIMTYIMAGVICFGIPLCGHYIGKVIKQEYKSRKDVTLAIFVSVIILVIIIGIAVLRADYLSYVLSAYNIKIKISPNTAATIFIGVNLFLFLMALFISYLGTHKNNEEYQKLKGQLEIARKNLEKESGESVAIIKNLIKIEEELGKIVALRKCLSNHYYHKAERLKECTEMLIQIYRTYNIESRPRGIKPPCFDIELTVNLPEEIRNPDWNCKESGPVRQT